MTERLEGLPDWTRLSDNVIRILGQNPGKFTLQGTNTYLVGTGDRRILIDTGEGIPFYEDILDRFLALEGCEIGPVLITHRHHDHVGGIDQIKRIFPNATFSKHYPDNEDGDYLPIRDGDEFAVEGAKLRAIHTPGHTTDHMCFYMEGSGALFTGDSVLGQGTAVFENLTTYLESLKKELDLNPTTLYPGHGPHIQGPEAKNKIQEYISHRQQREDEIVKVMTDMGSESGITPADIVKVIYAKYPKSLWPAAEHGIVLHLNKLKDEGKAKEMDGGKWILTSRDEKLFVVFGDFAAGE